MQEEKNIWKNSANWSILSPFCRLLYALEGVGCVSGWVGGNHQNIESSGTMCYFKLKKNAT